MEDLIKKFVYTGVGFVSLTAEMLQETVDEWVGKGKESKSEGKKIFSDFSEKVEGKREEWEEKMKTIANEMADNLNLPKFMTKEDFDALVKRIEALESKVNVGTKADVKKAPVKKAETKTTKK